WCPFLLFMSIAILCRLILKWERPLNKERILRMIGVIHKKWHQVPVLEVVHVKDEENPLPVVVYFHGFTSAKEHNLPLAYRLAGQGYRVLLPDSEYHGEREIEMSDQKRQLAFWDIVMQNVRELNELYKLLLEQGLLLDGRIGIAGTSMGGITTSAALVQIGRA